MWWNSICQSGIKGELRQETFALYKSITLDHREHKSYSTTVLKFVWGHSKEDIRINAFMVCLLPIYISSLLIQIEIQKNVIPLKF